MSDIKNYFKLKLLDIKFVSETRADITAGRYFADVDTFLQSTPQFVLDLNHMRIMQNEEFFLNKLECYNKIIPEVDGFFLKGLNTYKYTSIYIGARKLAYQIDDLEKQFHMLDMKTRNAMILKLCVEINEIFNAIKRVYSPKDEKKDLLAEFSADKERPWEQVPLSQILKDFAKDEMTRKRQIIVVDDMPVVLNTIIGILKKHYEVFAFTKGEQALKFLKGKIPDLFLLDIEMPEMNGYELFKEIRKIEELRDAPIIIMTGNATSEYIETAINFGISDFIIKPVDEHILLKKIWNNIDRKKLF